MSATQDRAVHERLVRWADSTAPTPSLELSELLGAVPLGLDPVASGRSSALRPVARVGIGVKVVAVVIGLGVVSAAAVGVTQTALRPPVIPDPVVVPVESPVTSSGGHGTPRPEAPSAAPTLPHAGPTAATAPVPVHHEASAGPAGPAVPKPRDGVDPRPTVDPSSAGRGSTKAPGPQTEDGAGRDPSTGAATPSTNDSDAGSPTSEPTAAPTG
jgi:hypothetical protein